MLAAAGIVGLVTIVVLIGVVTAGLLRGHIGPNFRTYHKTGGILLGLLGITHGTLMFQGGRTPDTAWHLCGSFGALCALSALAVALSRAKIGPKFLRIHQTLAFCALVLGLLHRILAFI